MDAEQRSEVVQELFSELSERGISITSPQSGQRKTTSSENRSDSSENDKIACVCEQLDIKQVLTAEHVQEFADNSNDDQALEIPSDVLVTPLARDRARDLGVTIRPI